ncbi:hypothetical protein E3P86_00658 [Wallemia ichthyophaga]|uniref:RNA helicase n=1 Tax=Wallemia ichthyophaga TaxID=245174 RepID=A0A4T0JDJ8_WALIC|nr:hypothetical protein E3P86_00658 [Wallemia ichthyophaga]
MAKDRSNRFNAKGRQSGLNKLKEDEKIKQRKRSKVVEDRESTDANTNADLILPKSKEQKEQDQLRKLELRKELESQQDGKVSSKKRKRLDAYITRQLKKEERKELIDKLSKSQTPTDASYLKSSANLGSRQQHSAQDKLDVSEHIQVKSALRNAGRRVQHPDTNQDSDSLSEHSSASDDDDVNVPIDKPQQPASTVSVSQTSTKEHTSPPQKPPIGNALGSALGASGVKPIVRPRKKKAKTISTLTRGWKLSANSGAAEQSEHDSQSSFDSSAEESQSDNEHSASDGESSEEVLDNNQSNRAMAFKEWAQNQMNKDSEPASEFNATQIPRDYVKSKGPGRALAGKVELPSNSIFQDSSDPKIKRTVKIDRSQDLQTSRMLLPVTELEQEIVETVLLNPITVICGETGSGKTTQLPQFLYERAFGSKGSLNPGMVAITQPRRVAAVSMANRVGSELGIGSPKVAYKIRYDGNTSPETAIKFMTDGVLLRELANDFLLTKYSVIIVDEAHERSVNTDILIGVLSRVVGLRNKRWKEDSESMTPLRLVIMSATLRVSDFTENKSLFQQQPPVVNVAARQHPVTIHFARRTSPDYLEEAMAKTIKIHKKLPPGGILVFLTGQGEIDSMVKKLKQRFGRKHQSKAQVTLDSSRLSKSNAATGDVEIEDVDFGKSDDPALELDDYDIEDEEEDLGEESGFEEAREDESTSEYLVVKTRQSQLTRPGPMHVLPLYSLLPSEKQMQVFEPPPDGSRLVVIATNVAETSLTIPGIRYVVDSGRAKERSYNEQNGMQSFDVLWISKASAAQRAGRAGRTGPGHTYRLYSSPVFENHFEQFAKPEILRMPIEGVVLQMKSMNLDVVDNFPFPTPPNAVGLSKAEKMLTNLGALTSTSLTQAQSRFKITELGRSMSLFPVTPRFAKMLVTGFQHGCLPYIVAIVSALSVGDPFLHEEALKASLNDDDSEDARQAVRKAYFKTQQKFASLGKNTSDLFKVLSAVGAYEYAGGGEAFCRANFLRPKAMEEIRKLRAQISYLIQSTYPSIDAKFIPKLDPPSQTQVKVIRQLITAGFIEQVAIRKDLVEESENSGKKFQSCRGIAYKAVGIEQDVYIHPSSTIFTEEPPGYITYTEIVSTSQAYMKGITSIDVSWLHKLGRTFNDAQNQVMHLVDDYKSLSDSWEAVTGYLEPVSLDSARAEKPLHAFEHIANAKLGRDLLKHYYERIESKFEIVTNEIQLGLSGFSSGQVGSAPQAAHRLVDYYLEWKKPIEYIESWIHDMDLDFESEGEKYTKIYHDQLFSSLPTNLSSSLRQHLSDIFSLKNDRNDKNEVNKGIPSLDIIGAQSLIEILSAEILYSEIRQEVDNNRGQWDTPILDNLRKWIAFGDISTRMLSVIPTESQERWNETWLQRFDFYACEYFAEMRSEELFDIIVDYPDSSAAVDDIRMCLERVQYKSQLIRKLKSLNELRLLHAGASTNLILTQYISTIKSLLIIDPSGVLLSSVAEPIRKYLRERPDTIRSIVANFVDEESELVDDDMDRDGDNHLIMLDNDYVPDWDDSNWEPEPIDAGPNFKNDGRKDLISTLVSIYDSKEVFVEELQVMLAQRLMSLKDYNLEKEIRNIEILKLKFGENTLHSCEVMLKDVADSKRIDQNIRSQIETLIRPIIVSRQFWPEIEDYSFKLTDKMKQFRESYEDAYALLKPDKRLHWIPQIGNISITIELEDRRLELDVTPFQAATIDLFGSNGGRMTASDVEEALDAPNEVIVQETLKFWVKKGVLKEEKSKDEGMCRRRKRLNQQGHVYEQQMYAPNQQNYPVPQMPYNQGGYGYNPPPGPPPGMDDHQPPPTKGMAAIARRRIVRRDAKKTAPIVIIILLIVIVVVAWLVGVERKRRRKKREYEAFVKSLPVLEQPNVATGIDVGNTHGQSPLDFINERYFGRDNHFSSAQRHFDDFDDEISPGDAVQGSTQSPPVHPPPAHTNQPPTPTNEQAAAAVPPPPSYTDSNNNLNIPPPSYNR